MSGESKIEGEVRFVNDVDAGADAMGSRMRSFGDTVPWFGIDIDDIVGSFRLVGFGDEKLDVDANTASSNSPDVISK